MSDHISPRPRGFTLIELMVVVAIIGLLIAIIMPSLGSARAKAKATACMSNLRQLGVSYIMYVNDQNNGRNVRPGAAAPGSNWLYVTLVYHSNDLKLYLCPIATNPSPLSFSLNASGGGWGSKTMAWNGRWNSGLYYKEVNPFTTNPAMVTATNPLGLTAMNGTALAGSSPGYVGSYTLNAWLFNYSTPPASNVPADLTGWMQIYSNISNQATTPVFTDGMWIDTNRNNGVQETDRNRLPANTDGGENKGQDNADFPPATPGPAPYTGALASNASWRIFVDRHNKCINSLFADGHGSPIPLLKLYNGPTWYNGWTSQGDLPAPLP